MINKTNVRTPRFIAFEGCDGCGKTTQLYKLKGYLETLGVDVLATREPGGTPLGEEVRRLLLHPPQKHLSPTTALFLFAASRYEHVQKVILPALSQQQWVLTDRYTLSTLAYQCYGHNLDYTHVCCIMQQSTQCVYPTLTFFIDTSPEIGHKRAKGKDFYNQQALSFHRRVHAGYCTLAAQNPDNIVTIKGDAPLDVVFKDIVTSLAKYVKSCAEL